jgi:hypothetical protein
MPLVATRLVAFSLLALDGYSYKEASASSVSGGKRQGLGVLTPSIGALTLLQKFFLEESAEALA